VRENTRTLKGPTPPTKQNHRKKKPGKKENGHKTEPLVKANSDVGKESFPREDGRAAKGRYFWAD